MRKTLLALAAAAVIGAGGVAYAQERPPATTRPQVPAMMTQMPQTQAERDAMHAQMSAQMPPERRETCDAMHDQMSGAGMGTMMQSMMSGGGMGAMMGGAH